MKISCVYVIKNIVNSQVYIGSTNNYSKRKSTHLRTLRQGIHHSPPLQRSWDKYGENNFTFEIIELCDPSTLLVKEQLLLISQKPKLNCSKSAKSPMAGRKHTAKTKQEMSIARTGKKARYKRKVPKEYNETRSNKRKNFKWNDLTKRKMRETAIRINSIQRIDHDTLKKKISDSKGITHNSLTEAAKYYNISVQAICDNLKGRSEKTRIGVTFKYV